MTETPEALSRRLAESLIEQGASEESAAAINAVPRHLFIPDRVWIHDRTRRGNDLTPLDRADDPDRWMRLVYSDEAIATQINDGHPDEDGNGREVSSSSSQPSVMAGMLDELAPQRGERILEIGTGTGWNAALLAYLVGASNVTSIEVDSDVSAHARRALDATGYGAVRTLVADGAVGWPDGAPFDKVISTVGVTTIPHLWVEQTAPHGNIVAPLNRLYRSPGIVTLVCDGDGTATGRLAGPAQFMSLRAEHTPRVSGNTSSPEHKAVTDIHPWRLVGDRAAAVAIGLRTDGIAFAWQPIGDLGTLHLYGTDEVSWASLDLLDEPPYPVEQAGPRRLFDQVETAYRWWLHQDQPEVGDWLVTVTPDGQTITLSPGQ